MRWATTEMSGVNLGDKRLDARLLYLADTLSAKASASIYLGKLMGNYVSNIRWVIDAVAQKACRYLNKNSKPTLLHVTAGPRG